jgi:hypothetical protein
LCRGQTPKAEVIKLDNGAEVNGRGFVNPVATQRAVGEQTGFSMSDVQSLCSQTDNEKTISIVERR